MLLTIAFVSNMLEKCCLEKQFFSKTTQNSEIYPKKYRGIDVRKPRTQFHWAVTARKVLESRKNETVLSQMFFS